MRATRSTDGKIDRAFGDRRTPASQKTAHIFIQFGFTFKQ